MSVSRSPIMQDPDAGFVLFEPRSGFATSFILHDSKSGDDVDQWGSRTSAIDAYEKARADVKRDMKRGQA